SDANCSGLSEYTSKGMSYRYKIMLHLVHVSYNSRIAIFPVLSVPHMSISMNHHATANQSRKHQYMLKIQMIQNNSRIAILQFHHLRACVRARARVCVCVWSE